MQSGRIRVKVVVFGQGGFIRSKMLYSGLSGCYSGNSVCIGAKVVVFVQNGL